MSPRRAFGSTYRLQLNGFGFAAATDLIPFLVELGVDTVYLSPVTRARPGSSHGYDVADPTVVDPQLGGRPELDRLLTAAGEHSLSVLLDIVPNHMAASTDNPFFDDVLRHGQQSKYAGYFDIAWDEQGGKVTLPVLDESLDDLIDAGSITVDTTKDDPRLVIGDLRYPLDPTLEIPLAPDAVQLGELIDRQHFQLINWRVANAEVNYRRFFDINELIGVRQEDPAVFDATHRLIVELVADPRIAGVRVDHTDGLRDPSGYLTALRDALGPDPVIEIEKILETDEALPGWPIDGTSGYEFAVAVTGLFIDPAGASALAATAANATGDRRDFSARAIDGKRMVLAALFPHQLAQITAHAARLLPDVGPADLSAALGELAVQLAVYRTYRRPGDDVTDADRRQLEVSAQAARAALTESAAAALDAILPTFTAGLNNFVAQSVVGSWQQLTSPLTAKGIEDTAIYDPGTLLVAADVGSDPDQAPRSPAQWHDAMADRQRHWPTAMSTLSTHDSKRSQDVRARLAVLSELPDRWNAAITAIDQAAPAADPDLGPDAVERRYLYETLVGAWPLTHEIDDSFTERVQEHLLKAGREGKRRSNWITPDLDHEAAVGEFVTSLLGDGSTAAAGVLAEVVREIEIAGATNSLSAVVLRAAAPGVPDIYQGDDSWFFALVDPDNRRRLDGAAHAAMLRLLPELATSEDVDGWRANWQDGRLKQYVVRQSLRLRRRLGDTLTGASYRPITASGEHADRLVAFGRETDDHALLCVVPRLVGPLTGNQSWPLGDVWGDTSIDLGGLGSTWVDAITGASVSSGNDHLSIRDLFARLPVALLERR